MSQVIQPAKIIFSKLAIQIKVALWKFKYVSADMIKH
jgi:hypothetical protein